MKPLLDELVTSLGQVGLKLNTSKTKLLTTQTQPGSSLQTSGEVTEEYLWFGSFKSFWPCALAYSLECIACSGQFGSHDMDAVESV